MKTKVRIGSWLVFLLSNPFQNVTKLLSSLLIAPSSAWTSLLGEFFPRSLWVLKVLRSSSDRLEFGFWANDARKRFESCNTRRKRRSLGFRRQGSEQKTNINDINQVKHSNKRHSSTSSKAPQFTLSACVWQNCFKWISLLSIYLPGSILAMYDHQNLISKIHALATSSWLRCAVVTAARPKWELHCRRIWKNLKRLAMWNTESCRKYLGHAAMPMVTAMDKLTGWRITIFA